MIDEPAGLGKWLMKTHKHMRRTKQELEVREMLEGLGMEYEEQFSIRLGTNDGRPGVRLEDGVSWVVVDFLVRLDGVATGDKRDVIIECARLTLGRSKSRKKMMERVRQRASTPKPSSAASDVYKRQVVCVALIEAPERGVAEYTRARIPSADVVVDSISELRNVLTNLEGVRKTQMSSQ